MDLAVSTGILLSDEDPFPEREHSGFPESAHSVLLTHACGVAACASTSHGMWRGKGSLCSWKPRRVVKACLVSQYQGTSIPVMSVTDTLFYET